MMKWSCYPGFKLHVGSLWDIHALLPRYVLEIEIKMGLGLSPAYMSNLAIPVAQANPFPIIEATTTIFKTYATLLLLISAKSTNFNSNNQCGMGEEEKVCLTGTFSSRATHPNCTTQYLNHYFYMQHPLITAN